MIEQYQVVCGSIAFDLSKNVNAAIKEGWQPLGGVSLIQGDGFANFLYAQAMVRYQQWENAIDA